MGNTVLDLFDPTKAELQKMATEYKDLTIKGIDDKEGFKKVHEAEMILKKTRVTISKTRKAFTDPKNAEIKQAIELEKEMLSIISPIEENLKNQKKAIEAEKERIKEEEAAKKREALQKRVDELAKYDFVYSNLFKLSEMDETEYSDLVSEVKENFEVAENERKEREAAEELERKKSSIKSMILNAKTIEDLVSAESFARDHKIDFLSFQEDFKTKESMIKHEEEKKKFEEEQIKLQEEKDQIAREKEEKKRKEEEEKKLEEARKEAAEKAKKEEQERMERETVEKAKKEKEEAEKLAKTKKYKEFLSKNEWKYDGFIDKNWKRILYKIVDEFIL